MARYVFSALPGFYVVFDTMEKRAVCKSSGMADAERIARLLNSDTSARLSSADAAPGAMSRPAAG